MKFEGRVEDYHMGTLLRLDSNQDVSEKNTSLGKEVLLKSINKRQPASATNIIQGQGLKPMNGTPLSTPNFG